MRVRFTTSHGGRKAGTVADLPDDKAKDAIKAGNAEAYENDGPMRLRFRRSATIEDKTFAAGVVDSCEQCDAAWECVNRGDADLDPPPGEKLGAGTQPFPPEWVNRDESTEAPTPPVQQIVMTQPVAAAPLPTRQTTTIKPTADTVGKDPHQPNPGTAKAAADADDLDAKTMQDLHVVAKTEGLEGYSTMHKDELVKAIQKNRAKSAKK